MTKSGKQRKASVDGPKTATRSLIRKKVVAAKLKILDASVQAASSTGVVAGSSGEFSDAMHGVFAD